MGLQKNFGLIFKAIPDEAPVMGEHLKVEDCPFDVDQKLESNYVLVQSLFASIDPYMRSLLVAPSSDTYQDAYKLNEPIWGLAIAKVLRSESKQFQPGDVVSGLLPMVQFSYVYTGDDNKGAFNIRKLENPFNLEDYRLFLGPLGMPGLTALSSLYDIGQPKKGETIFISSAAGAVGQIVGILAKHEGLKVIGSVGSDQKLDYIVQDLGFDGGFNYKTEDALVALKRLVPEGLDIYYDNVGGTQLDAALESMKLFGRIVACGMISDYNNPPEKWYGARKIMYVIDKRLSMRGFIVSDDNMGPRYKERHQQTVGKLLTDPRQRAKFRVDEMGDVQTAAEAFVGMLAGKNFGKAVVRMAV
ncbi:uncharacterized protein A1O5_13261 [Cladophialophora psammophila CBS 110553]|uniref:Enoyl reductase (ER) domain-containing protein n=1 Tax=Cladophialophora psammophila CBS 110553 TaxID=1182543 RepID=W9VKD6_9EURO|nr:uncharacterized protein A1O5_13261 [Cladophialophora psammophila CBS 110553]EXJ53485.1 hypothetical protein A1O5_13261 [Cladophialophora psammophila CBS 110553]